jgi:hypothetical protein
MEKTMPDITENPYESPQTEISEVKPLTSQGVLTETMLMYLKQASPWLRFVGIAGFIICGLVAVLGLAAVGIQTLPIPGYRTAMGLGFFIIYLGYVALMFFPVLFIFRFGGKIKSYTYTGNEADLEQAFKNNKSLWKFIGILSIISLALVALTLVSVGIAAFFGAVFS